MKSKFLIYSLILIFITSYPAAPGALAVNATRVEKVPLQSAALPGDLTQIQIPSENGKIEDIFQGVGDKAVILIQDAHAIPQAQKNIQKLIGHFQSQYGIKLIGVEGASSQFDPQIFRSFPDQDLLKKTFEAYLEKGELTGATAAAIFVPPHLNPLPLPGGEGRPPKASLARGRVREETVFHGVEDWTLYEQGLALYLAAMEEEQKLFEELAPLEKEIQAKKELVYSKELLEIDKALHSFQENRLDLIQVLKMLAKVKPPEKGSELDMLLKESEHGEEDQAAVEAEVREIAEQVRLSLRATEGSEAISEIASSALPPPRNDLAAFNQKYQEFQTSRITPQAFALYLKEIIEKGTGRKVLPVPFSIEKAYSRLTMQDSTLVRLIEDQKRLRDIEGTKFFKDFEQYARSVKNSIFRNEAEKKLDAESRKLELLRKLVKLELSREEWEEIREAYLVKSEADFKYPIAFYRNAESREKAFFTNHLKLMSENASRDTLHASLLIAGGFHTEGLVQRLKEAKTSYVLIRPKIDSIPEDSHYREQMRGEVSWRDYFEVEGGKINLYKAFVRAVRDRLLREALSVKGEAKKDLAPTNDASRDTLHSSRLLKSWRDQIIRDLAQKEQVAKAGQYTTFLDEVTQKEPGDELKKRLERVNRFIEKLQELEAKGQLTEQNILQLFRPAAISSVTGGGLSVGDLVDPQIEIPGIGRLPVLALPGRPAAALRRQVKRTEVREQEAASIEQRAKREAALRSAPGAMPPSRAEVRAEAGLEVKRLENDKVEVRVGNETKILQLLAKGGFGNVYREEIKKGVDPSQVWILKISARNIPEEVYLPPGQSPAEEAEREARVLGVVWERFGGNPPGTFQLVAPGTTLEDGQYAFLTQGPVAESFENKLQLMTLAQKFNVLARYAELSLEYLKKGIFKFDHKESNVLMSERDTERVYGIDLGGSKIAPEPVPVRGVWPWFSEKLKHLWARIGLLGILSAANIFERVLPRKFTARFSDKFFNKGFKWFIDNTSGMETFSGGYAPRDEDKKKLKRILVENQAKGQRNITLTDYYGWIGLHELNKMVIKAGFGDATHIDNDPSKPFSGEKVLSEFWPNLLKSIPKINHSQARRAVIQILTGNDISNLLGYDGTAAFDIESRYQRLIQGLRDLANLTGVPEPAGRSELRMQSFAMSQEDKERFLEGLERPWRNITPQEQGLLRQLLDRITFFYSEEEKFQLAESPTYDVLVDFFSPVESAATGKKEKKARRGQRVPYQSRILDILGQAGYDAEKFIRGPGKIHLVASNLPKISVNKLGEGTHRYVNQIRIIPPQENQKEVALTASITHEYNKDERERSTRERKTLLEMPAKYPALEPFFQKTYGLSDTGRHLIHYKSYAPGEAVGQILIRNQQQLRQLKQEGAGPEDPRRQAILTELENMFQTLGSFLGTIIRSAGRIPGDPHLGNIVMDVENGNVLSIQDIDMEDGLEPFQGAVDRWVQYPLNDLRGLIQAHGDATTIKPLAISFLTGLFTELYQLDSDQINTFEEEINRLIINPNQPDRYYPQVARYAAKQFGGIEAAWKRKDEGRSSRSEARLPGERLGSEPGTRQPARAEVDSTLAGLSLQSLKPIASRAEVRTKDAQIPTDTLKNIEQWIAKLSDELLEAFAFEPVPQFYGHINRGLKSLGYPELPKDPEPLLGELRELFSLETNLRILDEKSPLDWKSRASTASEILILFPHLIRTPFMRNRIGDIASQPQNRSDSLVANYLYKLQEDLGIKDTSNIPRGEFILGENGRLLWLNQDQFFEERKTISKQLPDAVELILGQEPAGLYAVRAEALAEPSRDLGEAVAGREKLDIKEELKKTEQDIADLEMGYTVGERLRELTADEVRVFVQAIRRQIEIAGEASPKQINLNSNLNFSFGTELRGILGEGADRGINKIYDLDTGKRRSEVRALRDFQFGFPLGRSLSAEDVANDIEQLFDKNEIRAVYVLEDFESAVNNRENIRLLFQANRENFTFQALSDFLQGEDPFIGQTFRIDKVRVPDGDTWQSAAIVSKTSEFGYKGSTEWLGTGLWERSRSPDRTVIRNAISHIARAQTILTDYSKNKPAGIPDINTARLTQARSDLLTSRQSYERSVGGELRSLPSLGVSADNALALVYGILSENYPGISAEFYQEMRLAAREIRSLLERYLSSDELGRSEVRSKDDASAVPDREKLRRILSNALDAAQGRMREWEEWRKKQKQLETDELTEALEQKPESTLDLIEAELRPGGLIREYLDIHAAVGMPLAAMLLAIASRHGENLTLLERLVTVAHQIPQSSATTGPVIVPIINYIEQLRDKAKTGKRSEVRNLLVGDEAKTGKKIERMASGIVRIGDIDLSALQKIISAYRENPEGFVDNLEMELKDSDDQFILQAEKIDGGLYQTSFDKTNIAAIDIKNFVRERVRELLAERFQPRSELRNINERLDRLAEAVAGTQFVQRTLIGIDFGEPFAPDTRAVRQYLSDPAHSDREIHLLYRLLEIADQWDAVASILGVHAEDEWLDGNLVGEIGTHRYQNVSRFINTIIRGFFNNRAIENTGLIALPLIDNARDIRYPIREVLSQHRILSQQNQSNDFLGFRNYLELIFQRPLAVSLEAFSTVDEVENITRWLDSLWPLLMWIQLRAILVRRWIDTGYVYYSADVKTRANAILQSLQGPVIEQRRVEEAGAAFRDLSRDILFEKLNRISNQEADEGNLGSFANFTAMAAIDYLQEQNLSFDEATNLLTDISRRFSDSVNRYRVLSLRPGIEEPHLTRLIGESRELLRSIPTLMTDSASMQDNLATIDRTLIFHRLVTHYLDYFFPALAGGTESVLGFAPPRSELRAVSKEDVGAIWDMLNKMIEQRSGYESRNIPAGQSSKEHPEVIFDPVKDPEHLRLQIGDVITLAGGTLRKGVLGAELMGVVVDLNPSNYTVTVLEFSQGGFSQLRVYEAVDISLRLGGSFGERASVYRLNSNETKTRLQKEVEKIDGIHGRLKIAPSRTVQLEPAAKGDSQLPKKTVTGISEVGGGQGTMVPKLEVNLSNEETTFRTLWQQYYAAKTLEEADALLPQIKELRERIIGETKGLGPEGIGMTVQTEILEIIGDLELLTRANQGKSDPAQNALEALIRALGKSAGYDETMSRGDNFLSGMADRYYNPDNRLNFTKLEWRIIGTLQKADPALILLGQSLPPRQLLFKKLGEKLAEDIEKLSQLKQFGTIRVPWERILADLDKTKRDLDYAHKKYWYHYDQPNKEGSYFHFHQTDSWNAEKIRLKDVLEQKVQRLKVQGQKLARDINELGFDKFLLEKTLKEALSSGDDASLKSVVAEIAGKRPQTINVLNAEGLLGVLSKQLNTLNQLETYLRSEVRLPDERPSREPGTRQPARAEVDSTLAGLSLQSLKPIASRAEVRSALEELKNALQQTVFLESYGRVLPITFWPEYAVSASVDRRGGFRPQPSSPLDVGKYLERVRQEVFPGLRAAMEKVNPELGKFAADVEKTIESLLKPYVDRTAKGFPSIRADSIEYAERLEHTLTNIELLQRWDEMKPGLEERIGKEEAAALTAQLETYMGEFFRSLGAPFIFDRAGRVWTILPSAMWTSLRQVVSYSDAFPWVAQSQKQEPGKWELIRQYSPRLPFYHHLDEGYGPKEFLGTPADIFELAYRNGTPPSPYDREGKLQDWVEGTVVDFGVGPGDFLETLRDYPQEKVRLVGVDYQPEMIAAATERSRGRYEINQVDMTKPDELDAWSEKQQIGFIKYAVSINALQDFPHHESRKAFIRWLVNHNIRHSKPHTSSNILISLFFDAVKGKPDERKEMENTMEDTLLELGFDPGVLGYQFQRQGEYSIFSFTLDHDYLTRGRQKLGLEERGVRRSEVRTKDAQIPIDTLKNIEQWIAKLSDELLEAIAYEPVPQFYGHINRGLRSLGYPELPKDPEPLLGELRELFSLETDLRILDEKSPLGWKPRSNAASDILILFPHLIRTPFMRNRIGDIASQPQNRSDSLAANYLYKLQEDLGIKDTSNIPRGEFIIGENGRLLWLNQDQFFEERKTISKQLPNAVELILGREPAGLYAVRVEAIAEPFRDLGEAVAGREKLDIKEELKKTEQDIADLEMGYTVGERLRELTADEVRVFVQAIRRQIEIAGEASPKQINLNSNLNFSSGTELRGILGEGADRGINKIYDLDTGTRQPARAELRSGPIGLSDAQSLKQITSRAELRREVSMDLESWEGDAFSTGFNDQEKIFISKGEAEKYAPNQLLLFDLAEKLGLKIVLSGGTARDFSVSLISEREVHPKTTDYDLTFLFPKETSESEKTKAAFNTPAYDQFETEIEKIISKDIVMDRALGEYVDGGYGFEHLLKAKFGSAFSVSRLGVEKAGEQYIIFGEASAIEDLRQKKLRVWLGEDEELGLNMTAKMMGKAAVYKDLAGFNFVPEQGTNYVEAEINKIHLASQLNLTLLEEFMQRLYEAVQLSGENQESIENRLRKTIQEWKLAVKFEMSENELARLAASARAEVRGTEKEGEEAEELGGISPSRRMFLRDIFFAGTGAVIGGVLSLKSVIPQGPQTLEELEQKYDQWKIHFDSLKLKSTAREEEKFLVAEIDRALSFLLRLNVDFDKFKANLFRASDGQFKVLPQELYIEDGTFEDVSVVEITPAFFNEATGKWEGGQKIPRMEKVARLRRMTDQEHWAGIYWDILEAGQIKLSWDRHLLDTFAAYAWPAHVQSLEPWGLLPREREAFNRIFKEPTGSQLKEAAFQYALREYLDKHRPYDVNKVFYLRKATIQAIADARIPLRTPFELSDDEKIAVKTMRQKGVKLFFDSYWQFAGRQKLEQKSGVTITAVLGGVIGLVLSRASSFISNRLQKRLNVGTVETVPGTEQAGSETSRSEVRSINERLGRLAQAVDDTQHINLETFTVGAPADDRSRIVLQRYLTDPANSDREIHLLNRLLDLADQWGSVARILQDHAAAEWNEPTVNLGINFYENVSISIAFMIRPFYNERYLENIGLQGFLENGPDPRLAIGQVFYRHRILSPRAQPNNFIGFRNYVNRIWQLVDAVPVKAPAAIPPSSIERMEELLGQLNSYWPLLMWSQLRAILARRVIETGEEYYSADIRARADAVLRSLQGPAIEQRQVREAGAAFRDLSRDILFEELHRIGDQEADEGNIGQFASFTSVNGMDYLQEQNLSLDETKNLLTDISRRFTDSVNRYRVLSLRPEVEAPQLAQLLEQSRELLRSIPTLMTDSASMQDNLTTIDRTLIFYRLISDYLRTYSAGLAAGQPEPVLGFAPPRSEARLPGERLGREPGTRQPARAEVRSKDIEKLVTHLKGLQNDNTRLARTLKLMLATSDNDSAVLAVSGLPDNVQSRIFNESGGLREEVIRGFLANQERMNLVIEEAGRGKDYLPLVDDLRKVLPQLAVKQEPAAGATSVGRSDVEGSMRNLLSYLKGIENDTTRFARTLKLILATVTNDETILTERGLSSRVQKALFNPDKSLKAEVIEQFLKNAGQMQTVLKKSGREADYNAIADGMSQAVRVSQAPREADRAPSREGVPLRTETPKEFSESVKEAFRSKVRNLEVLRQEIESNQLADVLMFGDKHGKPEDLERVLKGVRQAARDGKRLHVIGHGDGFDRGKQNGRNWQIFEELLQISRENPGIRVDLLFGNHDVWLIQAILLNDPNARAAWYGQGGREVIDELGMERVRALALWMLQNFELFVVDDRGFLHVHAGIPMSENGDPLMSREDLERLQRELESIQRELKINNQFLSQPDNRARLARFFEQSHEIFWARQDAWLDKLAGNRMRIDSANKEKLFDLLTRLFKSQIGERVPEEALRKQVEHVWAEALIQKPEVFRQAGIEFEILTSEPEIEKNKLDRFLAQLGISGVIAGHIHLNRLLNLDNRIFIIDVDEGDPGHLIFNGDGVIFDAMARSTKDLVTSRAAVLAGIDEEIIRLKAGLGETVMQEKARFEDRQALIKREEPVVRQRLAASHTEASMDKDIMRRFKQAIKIAWGDGLFELKARESTTIAGSLRVWDIKVGGKNIIALINADGTLIRGDEVGLLIREGRTLKIGRDTVSGNYSFVIDNRTYDVKFVQTGSLIGTVLVERPASLDETRFDISRTLVNHPARVAVTMQPGATSQTVISPILMVRSPEEVMSVLAEIARSTTLDTSEAEVSRQAPPVQPAAQASLQKETKRPEKKPAFNVDQAIEEAKNRAGDLLKKYDMLPGSPKEIAVFSDPIPGTIGATFALHNAIMARIGVDITVPKSVPNRFVSINKVMNAIRAWGNVPQFPIQDSVDSTGGTFMTPAEATIAALNGEIFSPDGSKLARVIRSEARLPGERPGRAPGTRQPARAEVDSTLAGLSLQSLKPIASRAEVRALREFQFGIPLGRGLSAQDVAKDIQQLFDKNEIRAVYVLEDLEAANNNRESIQPDIFKANRENFTAEALSDWLQEPPFVGQTFRIDKVRVPEEETWQFDAIISPTSAYSYAGWVSAKEKESALWEKAATADPAVVQEAIQHLQEMQRILISSEYEANPVPELQPGQTVRPLRTNELLLIAIAMVRLPPVNPQTEQPYIPARPPNLFLPQSALMTVYRVLAGNYPNIGDEFYQHARLATNALRRLLVQRASPEARAEVRSEDDASAVPDREKLRRILSNALDAVQGRMREWEEWRKKQKQLETDELTEALEQKPESTLDLIEAELRPGGLIREYLDIHAAVGMPLAAMLLAIASRHGENLTLLERLVTVTHQIPQSSATAGPVIVPIINYIEQLRDKAKTGKRSEVRNLLAGVEARTGKQIERMARGIVRIGDIDPGALQKIIATYRENPEGFVDNLEMDLKDSDNLFVLQADKVDGGVYQTAFDKADIAAIDIKSFVRDRVRELLAERFQSRAELRSIEAVSSQIQTVQNELRHLFEETLVPQFAQSFAERLPSAEPALWVESERRLREQTAEELQRIAAAGIGDAGVFADGILDPDQHFSWRVGQSFVSLGRIYYHLRESNLDFTGLDSQAQIRLREQARALRRYIELLFEAGFSRSPQEDIGLIQTLHLRIPTRDLILQEGGEDIAPVTSLVFSPDGQRLAWGENHGRIVQRNLQTNETDTFQAEEEDDPAGGVSTLAYSSDGQNIAWGRWYGIAQRNLPTGDTEMLNNVIENLIRAIAFSSDGQRIVVGNDNGTIAQRNLQTNEIEIFQQGQEPGQEPGEGIFALAYSPDSQRVVWGDNRGRVVRRNLQTGETEILAEAEGNYFSSLAFAPDEQKLAVGNDSGQIFLRNLQTGDTEIIQEGAAVFSLAFSTDSQSLAWGDSQGTVRVRELLPPARSELRATPQEEEQKRLRPPTPARLPPETRSELRANVNIERYRSVAVGVARIVLSPGPLDREALNELTKKVRDAITEISAFEFGKIVREEAQKILNQIEAQAKVSAEIKVTKAIAEKAIAWFTDFLVTRLGEGNLAIAFDVSGDSKSLIEAFQDKNLSSRIGLALFKKEMAESFNREALSGLNIQFVANLGRFRPSHAVDNKGAVPVVGEDLNADYLNQNRALFGVGVDKEGIDGGPFLEVVERVLQITSGLLLADRIKNIEDPQNAPEIKEIQAALLRDLFKEQAGQNILGFDQRGNVIIYRAKLMNFVTEYLARAEIRKAA